MTGRKPRKSKIRTAFLAAAAAFGIGSASIGIEQMPKDPVTDTQRITTYNIGTPAQYGYNISPIDQMWKHTLALKSDAALAQDLAEAARHGDSWRVNALLEHGVNVNARNGEPLVNAVHNGDVAVIDRLLAVGAKPSMMDNAALMAAALRGDARTASVLIYQGADAGARDSEALIIAAMNDHVDVARVLLDAKKLTVVQVERPSRGYRVFDDYDYMHWSPYSYRFGNFGTFAPIDPFYTSYHSYKTSVTLTVPAVQINTRESLALQYAVARDNVEMARLLISKGADTTASNGEIRWFAVEFGSDEMGALFKKNAPITPPRYTPPPLL